MTIELTEEQQIVIKNLMNGIKNKKKVQSLGGFAGTGKSLVVKHLKEKLPNFKVCAYTGKAVDVLKRKGIEASTIHSLIYEPVADEYGNVEFLLKRFMDAEGIIVDEACLPYTQRIQTSDGPKEIGNIVNQKKQFNVFSYNFNTKQIELKKITNWFKYPLKSKILIIKCSQKKNREMQKTLRCTPNHQVYLNNGSKILASKLKVGDKIIAKGVFLNNEQKSFLLGSLLGDASITKSKGYTPQLSFRHGEDQKQYLDFKYRLFHGKSYPRSYPSGYSANKITWAFSPIRTDDLDEIYNLVYISGKKTITTEWLDQINPSGLAAWYMDDGSLETPQGNNSEGSNVQLHTERFSENENNVIKKWLKDKYDLNASVYKTTNYFKLRLDKESSNKFFQIVAPWFCLSMLYKLPKQYHIKKELYSFDYYKNQGSMSIISIKENNKSRYKYVYDIEIEDNHNYFTNNVLVSNSMVGKEIFKDLQYFKIPLICVGDHGQLPPVSGGNFNLMEKPEYKLETVHRNAGDIAHFAEHIRNGLNLFDYTKSPQIEFVYNMNNDVLSNVNQVICAYNTTRVDVNKKIRQKLKMKDLINVGEKVMCLRNSKRSGIFNGMQGIVIDYRFTKGRLYIDFESNGFCYANLEIDPTAFNKEKPEFDHDPDSPHPFEYAYCITCHKAQGDEWDDICVIEQKCINWDHIRWAYTAASRARNKIYWIPANKPKSKIDTENPDIRKMFGL